MGANPISSAAMGRSNKKSGFLRSRFSTNVSTWFLAP
jgi:hypothetical protein